MISFIVQGGTFDQMRGHQERIDGDYFILIFARYMRIPRDHFEELIDNDQEFQFLLIT